MVWVTFAVLAAVIVVAGGVLARTGDILAEKSGMGRSWVGAILIAATTSLPELFSGVGASAFFGLPDIAVGNVLGSCMFNLLILSVMDAISGKKPLSSRASPGHALALGFGTLLMAITGLGLLLPTALPAIPSVGWFTPVWVVVYLIAAKTMFQYERRRQQTKGREALQYAGVSTRAASIRYGVAALVVVAAAIFLPEAGAEIARQTGLEQGFVGTVFIAMATTLPELVVSLTAVRMGSIDLAIGNALGSNLFNIQILVVDDLLYRKGPILADVTPNHAIAVLAVIAMNGVVLTGLTYQALQKRLVLSWDTFGVLVFYLLALALYATH
jgi:cation:H+ antiporter